MRFAQVSYGSVDSDAPASSCELGWRLVKFQPNYRGCKKWRALIIDPRTPGGRKKQLVVALARGFGVDWWRIRTGQTTPEKLGLIMND